ncbi:hypothetical protein [Arthrobacter sp. S41]|uniref:hypothetical protein n=1 Tax=Arthrobacter sp. S41 TaxID=2509721 RepID=UPI001035932C|nr:hypothetical protein [Arthrobacter sp. S41]TAP26910.1 hypothetical protein EYR88_00650 [Arthrobacter sp. S41]
MPIGTDLDGSDLKIVNATAGTYIAKILSHSLLYALLAELYPRVRSISHKLNEAEDLGVGGCGDRRLVGSAPLPATVNDKQETETFSI